MKRALQFLQKFLQRFNEDPRGWGILLVLFLGLIGERYYHVHFKPRVFNSAAAARGELRGVNQHVVRAGLAALPLNDFILSRAEDLRLAETSPEELLLQLKTRADVLTPGQRSELKTSILRADVSKDLKEISLRLLKLSIPASVPSLSVIALSSVVDPSLRISALEGIETAALSDRSFATTLRRISTESSEKSVADIARLSSEHVAKGVSFFANYGSIARANELAIGPAK